MNIASSSASKIRLVEDATQELMEWAANVSDSDATYFERGQELSRRLGAHYREDGLTEIGFWTPELAGEVIQSERCIYLEIFTPVVPVDFRAKEQVTQFRCDRLPLPQQGEYIWGVLEGIQPGTRDQLGSLYWLRYLDGRNRLQTVRDVVAYSVPYGVFGPAEVYDMAKLEQERTDLHYFQATGRKKPEPSELPEVEDAPPVESTVSTTAGPLIGTMTTTGGGSTIAMQSPPPSSATAAEAQDTAQDDLADIPRMPAPVNLLQLHIATASPEGTIEGLTRLIQQISDKLERGEELTSAEKNYIGYDGVQFLPVEPTIEYRHDGDNTDTEFFALPSDLVTAMEQEAIDLRAAMGEDSSPDDSRDIAITLRKPDTQNWGYDIPILSSSATNPANLGSLRPDEMIDCLAAFHNFSQGPIQVIYDLVYGHADNQAQQLIGRQFLKGPNMYGQDLNHQLPAVRAILLEMQRRKVDTGADGIRVDGGQDFRFFNPLSGRVEQDDAYLLAMSDVVQEIGGYQRLLFTIFEDGRPWPQEGWEETSTYRDLVDLRPESYQWGPLIFAHNTPVLKGFWDLKWRRVTEVMVQGDRWITGCANHDTVRRGNQIDLDKDINWNLGKTLPEALNNAYDHPAVKLWVYGFSPGLPMDFINALMHATWGFFRNTDDRYGVKVASEEIGFLDWQMTPERYQETYVFKRLKLLGFDDLEFLRQFCHAVSAALEHSDYDLELVARICQRCLGDDLSLCELPSMGALNFPDRPKFTRQLDVSSLKLFAKAFMEDMHDLSNVQYVFDNVDPVRAEFNLQLRRYRLAHPWVRENLGGLDRFNRLTDENYTVFYGLRTQHRPPVEGEAATEPESLVMVTHMGGDPVEVPIADWLQLDLSEWQVAIATPGLEIPDDLSDMKVFELKDMQGILLEKKISA
ncbi:MAG: glucosylglycerol hydrolase [Elainellaceae cyanobacterium]